MKKLFLLLAAPVLLVSCSDDDATPANPDAQTLAKTITYYPLESNYTSMRVTYFEGNQWVADTVFDASGAIIQRSAVTFAPNTRTITQYNSTNTVLNSVVYTYDSDLRLIKEESSDPYFPTALYAYNGNTVTLSKQQGTDSPEMFITFTKDSNGLITSMQFENNEEAYISFNGATPQQYISVFNQGNEQVFTSFEFFDVEKPQNMQLSTLQRNNIIIQQYQLNQVADTHSHYIKSYDGLIQYERIFNTDNYVTYTKQINYDANNNTSETFYYYE